MTPKIQPQTHHASNFITRFLLSQISHFLYPFPSFSFQAITILATNGVQRNSKTYTASCGGSRCLSLFGLVWFLWEIFWWGFFLCGFFCLFLFCFVFFWFGLGFFLFVGVFLFVLFQFFSKYNNSFATGLCQIFWPWAHGYMKKKAVIKSLVYRYCLCHSIIVKINYFFGNPNQYSCHRVYQSEREDVIWLLEP